MDKGNFLFACEQIKIKYFQHATKKIDKILFNILDGLLESEDVLLKNKKLEDAWIEILNLEKKTFFTEPEIMFLIITQCFLYFENENKKVD